MLVLVVLRDLGDYLLQGTFLSALILAQTQAINRYADGLGRALGHNSLAPHEWSH